MTDWSAYSITVEKQLQLADQQALLGNYGMALAYVQAAEHALRDLKAELGAAQSRR